MNQNKHTQEEVIFILRNVIAGATVALIVFSFVGLASALARWCGRGRDGDDDSQNATRLQGLRAPLLVLEEEENVVVIPPDLPAGGAGAAAGALQG